MRCGRDTKSGKRSHGARDLDHKDRCTGVQERGKENGRQECRARRDRKRERERESERQMRREARPKRAGDNKNYKCTRRICRSSQGVRGERHRERGNTRDIERERETERELIRWSEKTQRVGERVQT